MRLSTLYLVPLIAGAVCSPTELAGSEHLYNLVDRASNLTASTKNTNTAVGNINGVMTALWEMGPFARSLHGLESACTALTGGGMKDVMLIADESRGLAEHVEAVCESVEEVLKTSTSKAGLIAKLGIHPIAGIIVQRMASCLTEFQDTIRATLPGEDKAMFDPQFGSMTRAFDSAKQAFV